MLFLRGIEVHGKDLGHGRADPAPGPERIRPPDHDQPPAEIVDIPADQFLLLERELAAIGVDQDDRIGPHQLDEVVREVRGNAVLGIDVGTAQGRDQRLTARAVRIEDQDVAGAGDVRDGAGPVVLGDFVLSRPVGDKDRLELMDAARADRQ